MDRLERVTELDLQLQILTDEARRKSNFDVVKGFLFAFLICTPLSCFVSSNLCVVVALDIGFERGISRLRVSVLIENLSEHDLFSLSHRIRCEDFHLNLVGFVILVEEKLQAVYHRLG